MSGPESLLHDAFPEYRLRREFGGKGGIEGTDYIALGAKISRDAAFTHAANHRMVANKVYVETRNVTPWVEVAE